MFWILAIALSLIAAGLLWRGVRRPLEADAERAPPDASRAFFRTQLEGIDRDVTSGRLSEAEAVSARAELAREVIRYEKEAQPARPPGKSRIAVLAMIPVVALASLALYAWTGRSDLPAQPLSGRDLPEHAASIGIEAMIAQVETQMVETPNDARGWLVLGPVYMEVGRYLEAVDAFRRVLALEPPTPDRQTNLAEALIMSGDGTISEEAMDLLFEAAREDPDHVRSRFYIAGELTRRGDFSDAIVFWDELLDLAMGTEAWVETAQAGRAAAQAGLMGTTLSDTEPDATIDVMIRGMVEGLAARLYDTGGSADEWMQLVRARLELDGPEAARADLERGLVELSGLDAIALEDFGRQLGLTTE